MSISYTVDNELAKACIEHSSNNLLHVNSIRFFGQGGDNRVFLVNEKYLFRFPRTQEAEVLLHNENKVVLNLQNMVSLPIPKPMYFGNPTELYPFHFHGYEMLAGISAYQVNLSDTQLRECLQSFAHFLKSLHAIKSTQAQTMGAQVQIYDRTNVGQVVESLHKRMDLLEEKKIFRFDRKLVEDMIESVSTIVIDHNHDCLVHGDLDFRHLLIHQGKLAGIIDWGDVGINHPVVDFAVVHGMFPKSMHELFFAIYGEVEQEVWRYARFLALQRAVTLMLYGHDLFNDMEIFEAAKQSYEKLISDR